ncbi:hypothetical protein C5167_050004 [Papaver somniferum]|uniref:Transmembrane protein n=1 Tax=Papaver somniferum TaxID=3469 RepID=A0A4Y7KRL1_PAPSO|nr:hypothetical protein C5167_050004 [Papaver somniferum]
MERCKNDEIYGGSGWNDIFDEVVGMLFVVRLIKILKLVMKILVVLDVAVVMVVEVICDCWWVWNYKLVYTTPSTVEDIFLFQQWGWMLSTSVMVFVFVVAVVDVVAQEVTVVDFVVVVRVVVVVTKFGGVGVEAFVEG